MVNSPSPTQRRNSSVEALGRQRYAVYRARARRAAVVFLAKTWMVRGATSLATLSVLAAMLHYASAQSASAASLEERAALCLACHGEKGQSANPEVPSLGAQTAPYTLIQLFMFREKLRSNDIMNDAVKGFSDDDLRRFSDFIAKLPAPSPPAEPTDAARLERGWALIRLHRCDICHNPDLAGRDNIPRIAGQREDFLVKTLREYKSNVRPGYDASMGDVVQPITDAEITDLAYFAARRR
jgi:cytochrome c553